MCHPLSHRDLKIENLLLDQEDNIKLIGKKKNPTVLTFTVSLLSADRS